MKRVFLALFFLILCIGKTSGYSAGYEKSESNLKIHRLIPDPHWKAPLALDPAIPDDFIAQKGQKETAHQYFWGTSKAITQFLKGKRNGGPLFIISITPNVSYNHETKSFTGGMFTKEEFEQNGMTNVVTRSFSWGQHPVLTLVANIFHQKIHLAWIASPISSNVVLVNYFYPLGDPEEEAKSEKIWDTFIENTQELTGNDFYQALGQEMHNGYTLFSQNPITLKVRAERCYKTRTLLCIAEPCSSSTTSMIHRVEVTSLQGPWKTGKPIAKIYGTATSFSKSIWTTIDIIVSVMIKDVKSFSCNLKTLRKTKNIAYNIQKIDKKAIDISPPLFSKILFAI